MNRRLPFLLPLVVLLVALLASPPVGSGLTAAPAGAGPKPAVAQPTLLVYNTVGRLLAGDLEHTVAIATVQAALADYPANWPVVGVGTTNWPLRTGELIPNGTAGNLAFWWADPDSPSRAAVADLRDGHLDDADFPFIAFAIGDSARARTWTLEDVPDIHAWLTQQLAASGYDFAGIELRGEFSSVKTTVSYNIPSTGLDLSDGYVGEDYFRFGDYGPSTWVMTGVYAADPAVQQAIASPGAALHLHGYQPAPMLGGHITGAAATHVIATVWPLEQMVIRRGSALRGGQ